MAAPGLLASLFERAGGTSPASALLDAADWPELARALAAAPLPVAPALRRPAAGEGPHALRGRGVDYAQSRPYQPGDDMRAMHWALLARTGRPHVREFEQQHAAPWHGLIDAHGSMLFGTCRRTKASQAARAAVIAAGLHARRFAQAPLQACLWSTRGLLVEEFGCGTAGVRALARWLQRQRIAPPALPRSDERESLREFEAWARRLASRRSSTTQFVLCSDLAWLGDAGRTLLASLAAPGRVAVLRIVDAVEQELPAHEAAPVLDVAGGSDAWLACDAPTRAAFAQAAGRRHDALRGLLLGVRASMHEVRADADASVLCAAARGMAR